MYIIMNSKFVTCFFTKMIEMIDVLVILVLITCHLLQTLQYGLVTNRHKILSTYFLYIYCV